MVRKFTLNPAGILKLDKGTLQKGKDADITIWILKKNQLLMPIHFCQKVKIPRFQDGR